MMDGCRDTWEESADYFRGYDDGRFDALKENEYKCADSWRLGYADGKRDAVRHGEWVIIPPSQQYTDGCYHKFRCSECDAVFDRYSLLCPSCWARMDGKEQ